MWLCSPLSGDVPDTDTLRSRFDIIHEEYVSLQPLTGPNPDVIAGTHAVDADFGLARPLRYGKLAPLTAVR